MGRDEKANPRKTGRRGTRPRQVEVFVWTTPEEHSALVARAKEVGLSLSAYLRTVGLGFEPRSIFDAEAVLSLARVNADQGRLGGLLKLWLTQDSSAPSDVGRLLREIRETQAALAKAVGLARRT